MSLRGTGARGGLCAEEKRGPTSVFPGALWLQGREQMLRARAEAECRGGGNRPSWAQGGRGDKQGSAVEVKERGWAWSAF